MHSRFSRTLRWFLLVSASVTSQAQIFSVGVKAGLPITEAYSATPAPDGNSETHEDRYLIGPTAEIHFSMHLSFEIDALYRHNGVSENGAYVNGKSTVNDWQVPFLGKYEFKLGPLRPFADAGMVYRHLSGTAFYSLFYPYGSTSTLLTDTPNMAGFTAGGGITLKAFRFRLLPEVRYTRWLNPASLGAAAVESNQADLLVGFTF